MMFCKHQWKVLSETVTESKAELVKRLNVKFTTKTEGMALLPRKHIQIVTCDKCGQLKRFVEEI